MFHEFCFPSFASAVMSSQIPEKQMREWKELLLHGLPLYEPSKSQQPGSELSEPLDPIELKKQEILNNRDYDEYTVSLKHERTQCITKICPCVYLSTHLRSISNLLMFYVVSKC